MADDPDEDPEPDGRVEWADIHLTDEELDEMIELADRGDFEGADRVVDRAVVRLYERWFN